MEKLTPATGMPIRTDSDRISVPSTERDRIVAALAACAGNQSRAAALLGIPRRTFVSKLDAYQIPRPKKTG